MSATFIIAGYFLAAVWERRAKLALLALLAVGVCAASAHPAVVVVEGSMYCGGVAVSATDVVTNRHCVENSETATVQSRGGTRAQAAVVALSVTDDLALVRIGHPTLQPVELGNVSDLRVGAPVSAVGHPLRRDWVTTSGSVIGLAKVGDELYILHSAPTDRGNSGGALLDERGRLVGVNAAVAPQGSLAVPVDAVVRFLGGVARTEPGSGN